MLGEKDRLILDRADAVVGVDEVGRGCLAGPVVICAARFETIPPSRWVRDSKKLTPRRRVETAAWLRGKCSDWVVVEVWQDLIDTINILEATRLAMESAVRALVSPGDEVVVDHVKLGDLGVPIHSIKRADASFFSVAAASIFAKVHRDGIMVRLALDDDRWEWSRNMGYGTTAHRRAIGRIGRSYLHRQSFRASPVLP
ncbi:MAG: ribonuclease HII [Thermoanaerobaculales bacterium]|jgi:ribonuclease HII|nr:ribonuclease HII [Thermoanaerobaculales bacterium]